MKYFYLLLLSGSIACSGTTRTAKSVPVVADITPISHCDITVADHIQAAIQCRFYNDTAFITSKCVNVNIITNVDRQIIMSSRLCSDSLVPQDAQNVNVQYRGEEHKALTNSCGKDLSLCYIESK